MAAARGAADSPEISSRSERPAGGDAGGGDGLDQPGTNWPASGQASRGARAAAIRRLAAELAELAGLVAVDDVVGVQVLHKAIGRLLCRS